MVPSCYCKLLIQPSRFKLSKLIPVLWRTEIKAIKFLTLLSSKGSRHKLIATRTFHIYGLIWVKFGIDGLISMPFSVYEFRENRHCEIHTLLKGVNETIFVFSTFVVQFCWMMVPQMNANIYRVILSFMKIGRSFLMGVNDITFTCLLSHRMTFRE